MTKSEYIDYLKTPRWQKIRFAVSWRQAGACALCGQIPTSLIVHHSNYSRIGSELPADVIGLCRSCNGRHHMVWRNNPRVRAMATGQEELEAAHAV